MAVAVSARAPAGFLRSACNWRCSARSLSNRQSIVKYGVFPRELLGSSRNFRTQCMGGTPRFGVWAHICGTDLVRDRDGTIYVLEDNLRVPSGVSYMLENRLLIKRLFPELFKVCDILPIDEYTTRLHETLAALSPQPYPRCSTGACGYAASNNALSLSIDRRAWAAFALTCGQRRKRAGVL